MRSFLAVPLPEYIKEGIYSQLSFLEVKCVKRISKENLHLTIAFMGEIIDANDKSFFSSIIEEISFFPFQATLGLTGAFPSKQDPSILWIGLEKGQEEISNLRKKVYLTLKKHAINIDKKFHPHITVARLKESFDYNILSTFFKKDFSGKYLFKVDAIVWYESVLSQNGPEYKEILRKKFV